MHEIVQKLRQILIKLIKVYNNLQVDNLSFAGTKVLLIFAELI